MLMSGESGTATANNSRQLSGFIQDLNIFQRQLKLYPSGHPQLTQSCAAVLRALVQTCQSRQDILLGIAPDNILFEGQWLDASNRAIRDFAQFLSAYRIASIRFYRNLSAKELLGFYQLLAAEHSTADINQELPNQLQKRGIHQIQIVLVDFAAFQADDGPTSASPWNDFITELLNDKHSLSDTIESAEIAKAINQGKCHTDNLDPLISNLISRFASEPREEADVPLQVAEVVEQLHPQIQERFTDSILNALSGHPDLASQFLNSFPQHLLKTAIHSQSRNKETISARLVDLLEGFADNDDKFTIAGALDIEKIDPDVLNAQINILLLEDSHSQFVPDAYQTTLKNILNQQLKGSLPEHTALKLRNSLKTGSIENQCVNIIFNMLHNGVDAEAEKSLQHNLTEMARFYLDTGDFTTLREIFVNWSAYLYSGKANARFLDETVLALQTSELFMSDVLDHVEIWGTEKGEEISAYVYEVGEPYAELLIDRLGVEKQLSKRRVWVHLLEGLGRKAAQLLTQALKDQRWYLVRNVLLILSKLDKEAIPFKEIRLLATHEHPKVRQEALRIIFRYDPMMANRQLLKDLSGGDRESISAAVEIANLSHDDKVLAQLHLLLQIDHSRDPDLLIRRKTLESLSTIGKPQTVPVLARLLQKKLLRRRREKNFQQEIIRSLGSYPRRSVLPLLHSLQNGRDKGETELVEKQLQRLTDRGQE